MASRWIFSVDAMMQPLVDHAKAKVSACQDKKGDALDDAVKEAKEAINEMDTAYGQLSLRIWTDILERSTVHAEMDKERQEIQDRNRHREMPPEDRKRLREIIDFLSYNEALEKFRDGMDLHDIMQWRDRHESEKLEQALECIDVTNA